ncbi:MAG: 50S ribosomal protein L11 methyltransferase [Crocinitomicaceae bacterium]|tara:strand:+ start:3351 stop:4181 length:831 start_codon:yes stop_codon:yes gene_type:complete
MIYYQFEIGLTPFEPWSEIFTAHLGEISFEGFYEKNNLLFAFIAKDNYLKEDFDRIVEVLKESVEVTVSFNEIPHQNWNAAWESNFDPVFIENELAIIAPFHALNEKFKRTIVIEPKMSFGTGHHQTTYLMCKAILETTLNEKKILDMGSGTGVLAILCEMRGASQVTAIDIEPWSVENCAKNASENNCNKIIFLLGDVELIQTQSFDFIFANINKNILLSHMAQYVKSLNQNGFLYLSGFFNSDAKDIRLAAESLGLTFVGKEERESWCMLVFKK